ncbi:WASH complex subunit 2 isoform X2 [Garra rufa]|uniref:WASH complex subunit 2 isoform X2 n=1 Tax=Garra rufa TaxID=137080 RepID=UPI003CCE9312
MFKPPKMEDEEYSPFGGKGGLFSGGKGLFDDDDEGDLFSEAPKPEPVEKEKTVTHATEPVKIKKIPTGAVSIFPATERKLFGSPNDSDSLESKDNKSPVKPAPKVQATPKRASVGGGLFDDEDDDDDFFSGKTPNKSTPGQEKQMPKKTVDLFGGADEEEDDDDDEGGAIFVGKNSALPQQDKTVEGEEETRPPEKKPPAGAISMFGPGTKNILEGLRKRQPSTSEESAKSEESGPPPEAVKSSPALEAAEKTHSKGLFSDDEDSQLFASETTSKSKPTTQNKPSKASLSIFDDEEEEDLFSSTPKSKSVQVKKTSLQPKKPLSSTLFSDDEDQWMSSKPSKESLEVKPSGMKSSVSAPSRLPSVKTPQKDGLFDDDNDLFAATNESSKMSSQRVSLLFEDEDDDEDKEPLFGFKTPANKTTPEAKVSGASSLFESTEEENVPNVAKEKITEEKKSVEKKPVESIPSSDDSTEIKKKPVGAVSLFGGIDVLADKQDTSKKQTKKQEEIADGDELQKEGPPPMESKGTKPKKTALSLFDDDEDDDDDDDDDDDNEDMNTDEIIPAPSTFKSTEKNAVKDHGPRMKSTGVFQDEELLFSHTQQRDNDPDVDLFATSPKPAVPSQSSVKPVVPTLFGEDDDDDLFSTAKPKAPPKVPEKPSKPKTTETDKSTLTSSKASLAVNPASLLPGAVPRIPGAVSVIPGLAPASFPAAAKPLPATDAIPDHRPSSEGGVSFDSPVQVSTLQNANKGRAKGAVRRRPQTRAARQLSAQQSEEAVGESTSIQEPVMAASLPTFNPVSVRPSALTIPVSTPAPAKSPDEAVRPKRFLDSGDDLFGSDDLFATKPVPSSKHKAKTPEEGHKKASKTEAITVSKKDQASSIFDSHEDDLFATVKQKPVQKAKQMSFLDDDDDDIFGAGKSKSADSKNSKAEASSAKPDIFQDEVKEPPKTQKAAKEVSLDASLFDDVDIFADLTGSTKPKEKKAKKKLETKSIFDDDMDDIFSTGTPKPTVKPSSKSKKSQPAQDPVSAVETGSSIFDDPLNAFGGN